MRTLPFALLGLLALGLLPTAAPAPTALANGTFVDHDGVVSAAQVSWEGPCNGWGTLHVTLYRPTGVESWSFLYESSMTPDVCWQGLRCFECPPVPFPFAWTLSNHEGASYFTGGGVAYYDAYSYHPGAWSMQGNYLDGTLEFRGVLR